MLRTLPGHAVFALATNLPSEACSTGARPQWANVFFSTSSLASYFFANWIMSTSFPSRSNLQSHPNEKKKGKKLRLKIYIWGWLAYLSIHELWSLIYLRTSSRATRSAIVSNRPTKAASFCSFVTRRLFIVAPSLLSLNKSKGRDSIARTS